MANYAYLDKNNIVIGVFTGVDESDISEDWENFYSKKVGLRCLRTSYNTYGGIHYNLGSYNPLSDKPIIKPSSDQSKSFRKNFAGIGYTYDENKDAFIPPKPYESWILNEDTCLWEPPTPEPVVGESQEVIWDEENLTWIIQDL